jgi:predicted DsbA family dithiol-disulfide isomerase
MRIDIWSDVVCPWCAIGKAHLEEALSQFAQADQVVIRWHSFELDPSAPAVREETLSQYLAEKLGRTVEQVDQLHEQICE